MPDIPLGLDALAKQFAEQSDAMVKAFQAQSERFTQGLFAQTAAATAGHPGAAQDDIELIRRILTNPELKAKVQAMAAEADKGTPPSPGGAT